MPTEGANIVRLCVLGPLEGREEHQRNNSQVSWVTFSWVLYDAATENKT